MLIAKRLRLKPGTWFTPVFTLMLAGVLSACSTTNGTGFFSFGSESKTEAHTAATSQTQASDMAVQVKVTGSVEDVIARLKNMVHKNGMMVMGELHQGRVMSMVGLNIESESIFIGSAAAGKKLFSANAGAGIAVPVRINVYKDAGGSTTVAYVPPSRILSTYHNPMINKVAGMMDGKLKMMTGMLSGM